MTGLALRNPIAILMASIALAGARDRRRDRRARVPPERRSGQGSGRGVAPIPRQPGL